MVLVFFIFVVLAVAIAVLALLAPEGYEDERGFHYGSEPEEFNIQ